MAKVDMANFLATRVKLFKNFPAGRLHQLVERADVRTFEPNEAILEFGEENRIFGALVEGQAIVAVTDDSGLQHRLAELNPGDFFGEMALMTGDKTCADVIAVTRCTAIIIGEEAFCSLVTTHPPVVRTLSKLISDRVRQQATQGGEGAFRQGDDPYGFKLHSDSPVRLLVLNCGSSSMKYNFYDTAHEIRSVHGVIENIGDDKTRLRQVSTLGEKVESLPRGDHADAFDAMITALTGRDGPLTSPDEVVAVGHRVTHGGERFHHALPIDEAVEAEIERLSLLAPLHNPVNLAGIRAARRLFPHARHVAVFDTSFHQTLPPYAYLYGLPYEYAEKGIRRYGFHGMSHAYVALKAAETLQRPYNELEIVSCHLGNGASVCAIDHGRSMDTSMGFTPAEGLIMGTRSGTLDPAILIYLMRTEGLGADDLDRLINRSSGLKGLSGFTNDMRSIEKAADEGHHRALLAFKTFCYQVRKHVGAAMAAMGGMDALIFTGGIGQGSAGVRSLACQGLARMGVVLDEEKNQAARGFDEVCLISTPESAVTVLVVPTDEERMIARETLRTLDRSFISSLIKKPDQPLVPIEVSAHHVHLSHEHVVALFGPGHVLAPRSELSQPGQYACRETVTLIGSKGRVDNVRVLGPPRKETQVEIAMTEQFKLGIHPPVRESGDLRNTPGVTLEGPAGRVTITHGVICAQRHIHMSPADALRFGLRDRYVVQVKVDGDRELIFGDVLVRVHPDYRLSLHLDTDEANAAGIVSGTRGTIAEIQNRA
ncbi:MAG: hypothetical protein FD149_504 [Rhodospirillaceae bacterium]|nr:MAG: hypothetical protein FD149_504 [Rhodospirillaceae bacterium]